MKKIVIGLIAINILNIDVQAQEYKYQPQMSSGLNSNTTSSLTSNINQSVPEFLSPEQAFLFSAKVIKKDLIEIKWGTEEGYHLYHDSLKFQIVSDKVSIGQYTIPAGKVTYLPALGKKVEEHTGVFKITMPIKGNGQFILKAFAQGCADKGLCYPPFVREIKLKN